jgi:hypothetical protein
MTGNTNNPIPGFHLETNDKLVSSPDKNQPNRAVILSTRMRLEDILEEKRLAREISESYFYD